VATFGRPCPRGLFDGCPIPRELCTEDFERSGTWHGLSFLHELVWFVFPAEEAETKAGKVSGLADLLRTLKCE